MTVTAVASTCDTKPDHLTVEQAHKVMQEHLRCSIRTCGPRRVARRVLVDSGHMVLGDTSQRR